MLSFLLKMLKEAAVSICGLIFGALAVMLITDPFSYTLAPKILQAWAKGQKLELFLPDGTSGVKSQGAYSIYRISLSGSDFTGRLVVRDGDGKDTDSQSFISGNISNDVLAFNFRPVITANTGGGIFIGKREGAELYLGSLVGFAKEKGSSECVLRRYIAVVSDDRNANVVEWAKKGVASFTEWTPAPTQDGKRADIRYNCQTKNS